MEAASLCYSNVQNLSPSLSGNKIKHFSNQCGNHSGSLKLGQQYKSKNRLAVRCVALSVSELEKRLEAEMKSEGEEWLKMETLRGKCKDRTGMVDLLECLEAEAIMGDDEGKEPSDYNRRAQIFYKSSRVFQALKERSISSSSHQSS